MSILFYMTLQIVDYSEPTISTEGWVAISGFLFFLMTILVITTSLKSRKIKKLKERIKQLGGGIEED